MLTAATGGIENCAAQYFTNGFQQIQQAKFKTVALNLYAIVSTGRNKILVFPGLTRSQEEFVSFLQAERRKFTASLEGD